MSKDIVFLLPTAVYIALFLPNLALASTPASMGLDAFFKQGIAQFSENLSTLQTSDDAQSGTAAAFDLSDFNIQLSSSATFGINSVLNVSISPEIDFIVTPSVDDAAAE